MITTRQINASAKRLGLAVNPPAVRCAYEWLDAQKRIENPRASFRAQKHIIESWAGYYVSTDDVIVAADLHPEIFGEYPKFNLSARMVLPRRERLADIPEAGTHPNYFGRYREGIYKVVE